MKGFARWLLPMVAAGVAACSHSPEAPQTSNISPDGAATAAPGEALVYVLRDERFAAGHMLNVELADHGETVLPAGASRRWRVEPGRYVMRSDGSGGQTLKLDLAAGERVFVRASVTVTDGGSVGARFTRLPDERGQRAVTRTRLVAGDS